MPVCKFGGVFMLLTNSTHTYTHFYPDHQECNTCCTTHCTTFSAKGCHIRAHRWWLAASVMATMFAIHQLRYWHNSVTMWKHGCFFRPWSSLTAAFPLARLCSAHQHICSAMYWMSTLQNCDQVPVSESCLYAVPMMVYSLPSCWAAGLLVRIMWVLHERGSHLRRYNCLGASVGTHANEYGQGE